MSIAQSVGAGAVNRAPDVLLIQRLLNNANCAGGLPPLKVDGLAGPKTIASIRQFQARRGCVVDGRVDPGKKTLKELIVSFAQTIDAGVVPIYKLQGQLPTLSGDGYSATWSDIFKAFSSKG